MTDRTNHKEKKDGINYNGKFIEIYYSRYHFIDADNVNHKNLVKGTGTSSSGNHDEAEQIALLYLVENASRKKPHCDLKSIIITNRGPCINPNGKDIEYVLIGLPIFEKKGKKEIIH